MRLAPSLVLIAALAGCGSPSPVGAIRFHPVSPVWRVDDRTPLEKPPAEHHFYRVFNIVETTLARPARAMQLREGKRVLDTNALDEVPDSTWFTNRIGIRDLTIEELQHGPNVTDSPFDHRPWTITGAKIGGVSLGFTFEDALHRKFLLKFDMASMPEAETATHIITHRILWAIGYNVPEDHLGFIQKSDLVIGDKARKSGLDEAKLEAALKAVYHRDDGAIRVLASLFVPGKPIGPYPREGLRKDDPNDVFPHERRRSLRGQYSIFAWLDHSDIKEDNTLDTFHDGYVTHYLIDFGKALGVRGMASHDKTASVLYQYDLATAFGDLISLGLRTHSWDSRRETGLRGIGMYDVEHYDPGAWRPILPYWPLATADKYDSFWGAKLLMRFKPHELAAIVDQAHLSDPRARRYLIDTLIARQRKTARYWFDRVAPLDAFTVEPAGNQARLCFTDLTLAYLLRDSPTTYAIDAFDHAGKSIRSAVSVAAGDKGRTCTTLPLAPNPADYTIVRLRLRRDGREMPPVVVHLARDPAGRLDVVGLRRR
jgi:hypothetical protein